MALSTACPKFPTGKTRQQERMEKRSAQQAAERECYREVDIRDGGHCRITGVRVNPHAVAMLARGEHHHIIPRSRGGKHVTSNVMTVSAFIHGEINAGRLRTEGDADLRDPAGRLAGVMVERLTESGWEVWKFC